MQDFAKDVAKAFGAGDAYTADKAREALSKINQTMSELTAQAQVIQGILALVAVPQAARSSQTSIEEIPREKGLSEAAKRRIRELVAQGVDQGRDLTVREVIAQLGKEGIALNVGIPAMAVGNVMKYARDNLPRGGA